MGGDGKGAGAAGMVHDYYASFGAVLCAGPLDGLAGIIFDGKLIWPPAENWEAGTYALNALAAKDGMVWQSMSAGNTTTPGAAGASWRRYALLRHLSTNPQSVSVEGYGVGYLYWGTPNQTLDVGGEAILAAGGHPSYRGQVLFVGKRFLCGRERTSLPNLEFIGFRFPRQGLIYTSSVASGNLVAGHWYEVRSTGWITHDGSAHSAGAIFLATATTWSVGSGAPAVHETGLDGDWQANPFALLAEYLTSEIWGLGLPEAMLDAASWGAAAAAARSHAEALYISPALLKAEDGRAFIQRVLDHVDGWLRWNSAGQIEAGLWSHGVAPPSWTAASTVDYHDLIEPAELDPTSWQDTTNVTEVRFSDRSRAYKQRPARAANAWNRETTGGPRIRILERPYILRHEQALAVAAEDAKISGQPFHRGALVVRAEKAAAIEPGTLFRLTHDAIGLSVACRCIGKQVAEPPSGRVTLRYQTERGLAAIPYVATPPTGLVDTPQPPSRIANLEIVQIPPSLGDGTDFHLAVLAGRSDALTSRFDVWLRAEDSADFYPLATVVNFACAGLVDATLAPYTDGGGNLMVDDDTQALRVEMASETPAPDLDRLDDTQTDDAVEDNALLVFVVRASAPSQVEIMTVKSGTLVAGRTYDFVVRRARFGTLQGGDGAYSWDAGDRAWVIYRRLLAPFTSAQFAALATGGGTAYFRIVPGTAYQSADPADVYDAGTNPNGRTTEVEFEFADPFAPTAEWTAIQHRPDALTTWSDITDFDTEFDPSTQFRLVASAHDGNADLATADLQATAGNLAATLFSGAVSGDYSEIEAIISLASGDWDIVLKVTDATGRLAEQHLAPVGGGSPVAIRVRPAGWNVVANPVLNRVTPAPSNQFKFNLTCSTPASTIYYQITGVGDPPGPTWTTYPGGDIVQTLGKRVHAYAAAAGMVDSAKVRWDFRRDRFG